MLLKQLKSEIISDGCRIGGLVGMLGCYSLILAGVIPMDGLLKVVSWLLLSSASAAVLGGFVCLLVEINRDRVG